MKKLNTTYLDNLVSKILKETLEEKADTLVSKIKGDVCECGGQMYEGECNECGYSSGQMEEDIHDVEDINNKNEFDYVEESDDLGYDDEDAKVTCEKHIEMFGEDDEVTQKLCQGINITEALKGRQKRLDRNKNNKIDAEDFKMLRNGSKASKDIKKVNKVSTRHGMEEQETEEGNAFTGALSQARKSGKKDFEVDGKKFETKESKEKFIQKAEKEIEKKGTDGSFKRYCGGEVTKSCIDKALKSGSSSLVKKANFAKNIKAYEGAKHKKKIKESYRLTESEMVSMIEKIVLEQKSKTVKDPAEKNNIKGMGGSPRGLEVYKKVHNQDGKENEDYIKSVAKKMKDYLKDGSKGEYSVNPKIFPKGNGELEKMDKKAYIPSGAVEEYVDNLTAAGQENLVYDEIHPNEEWVTDNIEGSSRTGNNPEWANTGESNVNKKRNKIRKDNILGQIKKKAYNKAPQPIVTDKSGNNEGDKLMAKLESVSDKKTKQINEEFDRIKSLMGYNQKTQ
jgi:hypothetical protein